MSSLFLVTFRLRGANSLSSRFATAAARAALLAKAG